MFRSFAHFYIELIYLIFKSSLYKIEWPVGHVVLAFAASVSYFRGAVTYRNKTILLY